MFSLSLGVDEPQGIVQLWHSHLFTLKFGNQVIVTFVFTFAKTILKGLFIQASSTLSESPIRIDAK